MQSASRLASVMNNRGVSDAWREQYTWVKFNNGRVFGARLDRIYVSHNVKNRVVHTAIMLHPCPTINVSQWSVHW